MFSASILFTSIPFFLLPRNGRSKGRKYGQWPWKQIIGASAGPSGVDENKHTHDSFALFSRHSLHSKFVSDSIFCCRFVHRFEYHMILTYISVVSALLRATWTFKSASHSGQPQHSVEVGFCSCDRRRKKHIDRRKLHKLRNELGIGLFMSISWVGSIYTESNLNEKPHHHTAIGSNIRWTLHRGGIRTSTVWQKYWTRENRNSVEISKQAEFICSSDNWVVTIHIENDAPWHICFMWICFEMTKVFKSSYSSQAIVWIIT